MSADTKSTAPEAESSVEAGPTLSDLKACLADEKAPIAKRMRSVFFLKQMGGLPAIEVIATGKIACDVV